MLISSICELFNNIPRHLLEPFFAPINEHLKDDPDWLYEALCHKDYYTNDMNNEPDCIRYLVFHLRTTNLEFDMEALHKSIDANNYKMP